ncbi:putative cysteine desulfurase NifS [Mageeibacillus indolicus UPII9-5]|uniref:Putative cysteine desulfurase NifS n=1 Tax=Mageeibacillus indolicus (strain UPII9-5) TaxID=699246 RepID=D3R2N8_MAGIU|nr:cysteine desulfurase family protein [Mageeibacillus indolicus]ADC90878.1 putative cysteine desulfurase NifS [Mageeibacillus indolicus UPII9-5]
MNNKTIYFDYAATTPMRAEVLEEVNRVQSKIYGNPSSVHALGRAARNELDLARIRVAACLNCPSAEIFFTSGGTESDNWAIKGVAKANAYKGKHIITSAVEHHAVLHTCRALAKEGFKITYLPVDAYGMVDPGKLEAAINAETILVSVMTANNEVGTLQPIAEIGEICRKHGVIFHTDAVQAAGTQSIDVERDAIDLCSLSGHKIYGPKGVGCLYVRRGIKIKNLLDGGGQERTKRAGTENLPAIVGMARALELAEAERMEANARLSALQSKFIRQVSEAVPGAVLRGHPTERLPNNINFTFAGTDGEALLLMLDGLGYCCSAGSACTAGSLEASHVLLAMGIEEQTARSSLRISIGKYTTEEELNGLAEALQAIIKRLQEMK